MRTFKRILATLLSIAFYFGACNLCVLSVDTDMTFNDSLAPTFVCMVVAGLFTVIIWYFVNFLFWLFD